VRNGRKRRFPARAVWRTASFADPPALPKVPAEMQQTFDRLFVFLGLAEICPGLPGALKQP
jgi:hypothetical protein